MNKIIAWIIFVFGISLLFSMVVLNESGPFKIGILSWIVASMILLGGIYSLIKAY